MLMVSGRLLRYSYRSTHQSPIQGRFSKHCSRKERLRAQRRRLGRLLASRRLILPSSRTRRASSRPLGFSAGRRVRSPSPSLTLARIPSLPYFSTASPITRTRTRSRGSLALNARLPAASLFPPATSTFIRSKSPWRLTRICCRRHLRRRGPRVFRFGSGAYQDQQQRRRALVAPSTFLTLRPPVLRHLVFSRPTNIRPRDHLFTRAVFWKSRKASAITIRWSGITLTVKR